MSIPAALHAATASDATLSKQVDHVHKVTKTLKEALSAAGNQYQELYIWIFNLQAHWTLGSAASGQGNSKPNQSGTGNFWGDALDLPQMLVPGAYTLQVSSYSAQLTLYTNDGKIIMPPTYFSGYADPNLTGFYTGTWSST